MQPLQQPLHVATGANSVTIHAPQPRSREEFSQPLLALLRTRAEIEQMLALTLRTALRHTPSVAAVMALQALTHTRRAAQVLFAASLVVRQRNRAIFALDLLSTAAAHHHEAVSPAVQQDDHLLASVQRRLRLLNQLAREKLLLPCLPELFTHVDGLHHG